MKHKADIAIGCRCYLFLKRKFGSIGKASLCTGIAKNTIYGWKDGQAPGGYHLQKLVSFGADPRWLLTGFREVTK